MPSASSVVAAWLMVSQSDTDPMMMPTLGFWGGCWADLWLGVSRPSVMIASGYHAPSRRFRYPPAMRAWIFGGGGLRAAIFLLPACTAAWAVGCSDDAGVTPDLTDDGGLPEATVADTGGDLGPTRDCTADLKKDEGLWTHLECSGLYESFATKTLAKDALAYKPATEFWSDGAEKNRWVRLPPGSKIDVSNYDEWKFPTDTKVWKEFKLGGKRIETRLFRKLDDGSWAKTSYRWNDDETDAVRKDGGELIKGIGPDGGTYEIPTATQCDECHLGRIDSLLGFDAVSLGLPSATGETLARLAADGWLSENPPKADLTLPGSEKAGKAVGWLHANCGSCHNPNTNASATHTKLFMLVHGTQLSPTDGGAPVPLEQLDVYKTAYCVASHRPDEDAGGGVVLKFIRGGNAGKSAVSVLSGRREGEPNTNQMPPLVTRAVDLAGHQLLDDWIAALPACP